MTRWLSAAVLLGCCGCGGGFVSGTILGVDYPLTNGFLVVVDDGTSSAMQLVLSDRPDFCKAAQQGQDLTGSKLVIAQLAIDSPDGPGVFANQAGTYPVLQSIGVAVPGRKGALIEALQVACVAQVSYAINGRVQIDHLELKDRLPVRAVGSMDLHFLGQDALAGDFDLAACPGARLAVAGCK